MITPGQMHKWHGNTSRRMPTEAQASCWLRRVVGWLRRIGHWLREEESWSVIYPDGQRSRRMGRRNAKAYRAIFGGIVIFNPRKPANARTDAQPTP